MTQNISITIRCFSLEKEKIGQARINRQYPAKINSQQVYDQLIDEFPDLKGLPVRTAVNQEYITEEIAMKDGDEIAFIPPVSGG